MPCWYRAARADGGIGGGWKGELVGMLAVSPAAWAANAALMEYSSARSSSARCCSVRIWCMIRVCRGSRIWACCIPPSIEWGTDAFETGHAQDDGKVEKLDIKGWWLPTVACDAVFWFGNAPRAVI